ncbi:SRPBCC family protein [Actinokineospora sp.]|uniref:SRPBCC family protein n=1 Tax=Actinokineospora sp. TaxID=1872133 RepID=UPI0040383C80
MEIAGLRVMVEVPVAAPPAEVWTVLADLPRIADWSPECVSVEWAPGWVRAAPGARFHGVNRAGTWQWSVDCMVTEAARPTSLSWVVLGAAKDPDNPSSSWTYTLDPLSGDGTLITQSFVHGPGGSYLVQAAEESPEHAAALVDFRAAVLRHNMVTTLAAMAKAMGWQSAATPCTSD